MTRNGDQFGRNLFRVFSRSRVFSHSRGTCCYDVLNENIWAYSPQEAADRALAGRSSDPSSINSMIVLDVGKDVAWVYDVVERPQPSRWEVVCRHENGV